jgi:hypothetical protein
MCRWPARWSQPLFNARRSVRFLCIRCCLIATRYTIFCYLLLGNTVIIVVVIKILILFPHSDDESAAARAAAVEGLWLLIDARVDSAGKTLCDDEQIEGAVLQLDEWLVDNKYT